jgi:Na+/proline symporter
VGPVISPDSQMHLFLFRLMAAFAFAIFNIYLYTTAGGYFGFWLTSAVRCSGTFVAFRRELFWCLVLLVVFYIFYFFHRPLRPQTPDRSTTLPPADRQPQTSPLNSPETSPESPSHTPQTKTD